MLLVRPTWLHFQGGTRAEAAETFVRRQKDLSSLRKHGEPIPPTIVEEAVEVPGMKRPVVSASAAIKAFQKLGYGFDEQHGSNIIFRHAAAPQTPIDPNHKELAKGTFRALIREAGLPVEEFTRLL